jgi:tetratricopeptide (TPR) repeat protein
MPLVGLFKRLFGGGGDERRAIAAEAAGDYAEAARYWALAEEPEKVAEMHILRAERATDRGTEIGALRDALRWAPEEAGVRRRAARALAGALMERAKAEGVSTEKDRAAVREAAALFDVAGEQGEAGTAWELAGDDDAAARAYEKGGLVDRMEQALARDEKRARGSRRLKEAFEEYELFDKGGDRESARGALARCVDLAEDKGEYRRLLGDLDARRLVDGRVALAPRASGKLVVVVGRGVASIGRDATCDLSLRSGGVSRTHAEIVADTGGFRVRDAGSRNGTLLGGMLVAGELPLEGAGELALGEDCVIGFTLVEAGAALRLEVVRGLDKGITVLVVRPGASVSLAATTGLAAQLAFSGGRPYLEASGGRAVRLNGTRLARGAVQLVRRDHVVVDDVELEVV